MLTFLIYLIGISNKLPFVLGFSGFIATVAGAIAYTCYIIEGLTQIKPLAKLAIIGPILILISALIPDPKTIAAMATIPPAIEYVQENEELKKIPDNVIKFINNYLEEANHGKD